MIQHHEGAIAMVQKLFQSQGATQNEYVFRFASDVDAGQSRDASRGTQGSRCLRVHVGFP